MKLKSQEFGTFSFPTEYEVIKSATLNKTDLANGNNKFYQIEAHISKDGSKFRLYSCYGRVGASGVKEERIPSQDKNSLEVAFNTLLSEKTSKKKGYQEVKVATTKVGSDIGNKMILSDDVKKDKIITTTIPTKSKITLDLPTTRLIKRLYDEAGHACAAQLNTGQLKATEENPLGTLTLSQLSEGRSILQEIQSLLVKQTSLIDSSDNRLVMLSNQFYTAIPQVIPLRPKKIDGQAALTNYLKEFALNNATKLDEKEDLLELLSDVEGMSSGFASNDIEAKYFEIGCKYELLSPNSFDFKKVSEYVAKSRSNHHYWKANIRNIWKIDNGQAKSNSSIMEKIGNVKELFHGSRPSNILGICKKGLLMRPPGVYITGSMFGNGIYFADQSSKSEQYATARFGGTSGAGESYFMFVADVALGKVKKFQNSQSNLNAPPTGYNSVQGEKGRSLLHNEFIIYTPKQNILRYLIEFTVR